MKIENLSLKDIKPYAKNPRNNKDAVDFVANSIREFGVKQPIVIDADNVVVVGHTRLLAAKKLKMKEFPCVRATDLSDEQIKAYRIADNSTGEVATWDDELLKLEIDGLPDFDFGEFGLDLGKIDGDAAVDAKDYTEEELEHLPVVEKNVCTRGDIWQLGSHRLMCGDSSDESDVKKLMGGVEADMILTDPPYNLCYEGKTAEKLTILNDNMNSNDFLVFLKKIFTATNAVLKKGGAFYIWHADTEGLNFRNACAHVGWKIRQCLVWNKNSFVMGGQDYQWKHEPCLYGWKDGAAHFFVDERTNTTVIEDKGVDFNKLKRSEAIKMLQDIFSDKVSTTILNENKPLRNGEHPTMKPVNLLARSIRNSSRQNETVLDLFGGSGSTLIACEQLNRTCCMMELDPKYCDVIVKRWETLTCKKAQRVNDGDATTEA